MVKVSAALVLVLGKPLNEKGCVCTTFNVLNGIPCQADLASLTWNKGVEKARKTLEDRGTAVISPTYKLPFDERIACIVDRIAVVDCGLEESEYDHALIWYAKKQGKQIYKEKMQ